MSDENYAERIEKLEARIAEINADMVGFLNEAESATSDRLRMMAEIHALHAFIVALAERAGLPREQSVREIGRLMRQQHDLLLRKAEDINPSLGARLDGRSPQDLPDL